MLISGLLCVLGIASRIIIQGRKVTIERPPPLLSALSIFAEIKFCNNKILCSKIFPSVSLRMSVWGNNFILYFYIFALHMHIHLCFYLHSRKHQPLSKIYVILERCNVYENPNKTALSHIQNTQIKTKKPRQWENFHNPTLQCKQQM